MNVEWELHFLHLLDAVQHPEIKKKKDEQKRMGVFDDHRDDCDDDPYDYVDRLDDDDDRAEEDPDPWYHNRLMDE
jgi:hypothetical protein